MSRVPTPSAAAAGRPATPAAALAGFRPASVALAVAAAFSLQPLALQAQPSGAQVIHGQASFARDGANLLVTTGNGAGTSHSAIDWQSFSVPVGSTTRFLQPSAASTSINRVVGPDPSAIFGTLSSNGRLVLVNPAGIAVGQGAVVDTAGFTASTLGMSDADAIAGRLRFGGSSGGALQVDGHIVARSGDVVLIAPQLQAGSQALVESQGATLLAAGHKVEITGRGLEGIHLEVQAGTEAVNLGTLKGDAVGIFAGTLRHSGLVQAQAVSTEGGKVVLRASGDSLVEGAITAAAASGHGGSIDVLGQRVGLLAGAQIDASGAQGGGQVRIGGDYQGGNALVPNAQRTYVDAAASIQADATQQGNGGRVIVWSDEVTRMHGRISARGGAQGGDGGFAEVSGQQQLEFTGLADLRAPAGSMGTLLLDPEDIHIIRSDSIASTNTFPSSDPGIEGALFEPSATGPVTLTDAHLNAQLGQGNVLVRTSSAPSTGNGGQITVETDASVSWSTAAALTLLADKGITVDGRIHGSDAGSALLLHALGGDIAVNDGASVDAGSVSVQAIAGGANVRVDGSLGAVGGPLDVAAGGSILGDGYLYMDATTTGSYGSIRLTATDGAIRFGAIDTAGNSSYGPAGNVTLQARGDIDGGWISAWGSYGDYYGSGAGGNAGVVKATSSEGSIAIGQIDAYGGYGSDTASAGSGPGGMGGDVALTATQGGISVNWINVSGGSAGSAAGGMGGTVALRARNDLTIFGGQGNGIFADGGGSGDGAGGDAGSVNLLSTHGAISAPFSSPSMGPGSGSLTAFGGAGRTGGRGGKILLDASGNLDAGLAAASGGGGQWGGSGGQGGEVRLRFGGDLTAQALQVRGGDGGEGDDSGGNGGTGGTGGVGGIIALDRHGGNLVLDGSMLLDASGGPGGHGIYTFDESVGAGGVGGAGGQIMLTASPAAGTTTPFDVVLRAPALTATRGQGGYDADWSLLGASGAMGSFSAKGRAVEVEDDFGLLGAVWTNDSVVNLRGASTVYGDGALRNLSDLHLFDMARLDLSGGVVNEASGRMTSWGADTMASLTGNAGFLEVVAGSTLHTPQLLANGGTVKVDGKLAVGEEESSGPSQPAGRGMMASAIVPVAFSNQAGGLITGHGEIALSGGNGTLRNFGTIAPGDLAAPGTLAITGNLVMEAGSRLLTDLQSTSAYDALRVSGGATTGGGYTINYLPGAAFGAGSSFKVLQAGSLDASTVPTLDQSGFGLQPAGNDLLLVAGSAYPALPPEAPPPAPPEAPGVEPVQNQVIAFAQLFLLQAQQQREESEDKRIGRDDIVLTDTLCKP